MQIGATTRLSATVYPYDVDTSLQWASSNSGVAFVESNGIVAAVGKGSAYITVTTINGCTDICQITVEAPKKVAGFKLKAGKKQLTATWKKASGVTGYQIEYGLKKSFKGAKKVTVKGAKTVKYTLKSLKSKKSYYVRIRAYKKVNGKTYWSEWVKASKKTK